MKKTVVSFADNSGNYLKLLSRLDESLKSVKFDGEFKGYRYYEEINSPHHNEIPYAFKPFSINKSLNDGAELILWCDSPVYAINDISNVFNHIKEHGYLFFNNIGYSVGDFTSDECLSYFGVTREESLKIPMIMACVMGFNAKNEHSIEFLKRYFGALEVYPGSWKVHRHDQSVASLIIHQMGLEILQGNETFFMYDEHIGVIEKSDTVCLLSKGI